jgi:SMODS-associated and fused to various effectors sensor domain
MEGSLTAKPFSLGELAHIVGQQSTPGSPRGQVAMPAAERDRAENLVLVCANEHDEIDRDGALDILTVDKLHKIKHDHEDWIRRITGCTRNRTTVVLRMIGQVRDNAVELTRPTACEAVLLSDDRYPDFPLTFQQQGVEIDLRHVPGEAGGERSYWDAARSMIDEIVNHQLQDGVRHGYVEHVSVFAFARLPLLVYLGSRLDDTYRVEIYQRHRKDETWVWPDEAQVVEFEWSVDRDRPAGPDAVVLANVSGTIQREEIPGVLRGLPTYVIEPKLVTPHPDVISNRQSLIEFVSVVRGLLSQIEATSKSTKHLHVLAALPISAAVALGRARDPHVHPTLVVYDRRPTGDYLPAVEIA